MGDVGERLSDPHDVQCGNTDDPTKGPRFHLGRVVRDRLEGEVRGHEAKPLAGHEVAGDGAVESTAEEEDACADHVKSPRTSRTRCGPPTRPSRRESTRARPERR